MFCPQCRTEYREGFSTCSDCSVDLVTALPPEPEEEFIDYEEILSTYNPADIAIIKSLLDGEQVAYFFRGEHLTLRPMGDAATLMVQKDEAENVRQLLSDLSLSYMETSLDEDEKEEKDEDENDDDEV